MCFWTRSFSSIRCTNVCRWWMGYIVHETHSVCHCFVSPSLYYIRCILFGFLCLVSFHSFDDAICHLNAKKMEWKIVKQKWKSKIQRDIVHYTLGPSFFRQPAAMLNVSIKQKWTTMECLSPEPQFKNDKL